MEANSILWIDDDIKLLNDNSLREDTDVFIVSLVKEFFDREHLIKWKFCNRIGDGKIFIEDNTYDFVIIDLLFNDDLHFTNSKLIDALEEKGTPYIVISNSSNDVVGLQKSFFCLGRYNKDIGQLNSIIDTILNQINLPVLRFLQISDLHFAGNSDLPQKKYQIEQGRMINKLIDSIKDPIDFLCLLGDYVVADPIEEHKHISDIVLRLMAKTVKSPEKLLIIPGNHDIHWEDFKNKKLANDPWYSYSSLILDIFQGASPESKEKIFKNSNLFESGLIKKSRLKYNDFFWSRRFEKEKVEIIGLSSITEDIELQGKGLLTEEAISFIEEMWKEDLSKGYLRIILVHHNVFPATSINSLEENSTILNSGALISLAAKKNCKLIFSGHSHFGSYIKFSFDNINPLSVRDDFQEVINIASGTSGGHVATLDRSRSFNVVEVIRTRENPRVQIKTYFYDSVDNDWVIGRKLAKIKLT